MSLALVEGKDGFQLGADDADAAPDAFMRRVAAEAYSPDAEAYKPDPADDEVAKLRGLVEQNAVTLEVNVSTRHGQRETFSLSENETGEWLRAEFSDRMAIANRKIRERHVRVAFEAAARNIAKGAETLALTAEEEACLREVNAVEDVRIVREGAGGPDGYVERPRLREAARDLVARSPKEGPLREDFFDDACGSTDAYGYMVAPTQREFLPIGGPSLEQPTISETWLTLAKCLAGDTKIPLLDGTRITLAEMAQRGGEWWVYANDGVHTVPAKATHARFTGTKPTVQVVLDTGEVVRATPDHRFMLRDGSYREAGQLQPGDRLMPLYRKIKKARPKDVRGYEHVYHPGIGLWEQTHRMVARTFYPEAFFSSELSKVPHHVDHIDENCTNNEPENLQVMAAADHLRKTVRWLQSTNPDSFKTNLGGKSVSEESRARLSESLRRWHAAKEKTPEHREKHAVNMRKAWADGKFASRAKRRVRGECAQGHALEGENVLKYGRARQCRTCANVYAANRRARKRAARDEAQPVYLNHSVENVLPGPTIDVYDLTVDGFENFAIDAGIIVHNCRQAYVLDPVVRHGCHILADFVLGRGVEVIAQHPAVQRVVDEFMDREKLNDRLHPLAVSLSRDGEIFERIFRRGDGRVSTGELHPATIWGVVTDVEDLRDVKAFVQRYAARTQQFAPLLNLPLTKYIERIIPGDDVLHVKINASQWDERGKSDIYPALGWAKRLRDYFDAAVQKEQAAASYQWHYKVAGGNADVQRITTAISGPPPPPGSNFVTNAAVDVVAVASGTNAVSKDGGTYEALLNHIAVAFGLSKDYFGAASRNSRASALIATEPSAKRFEQRQGVISSFIERLLRVVVAEAKKYGLLVAAPGEDDDIDEGFRVVFPQIITADSAARILLLRQAFGMGAISHRRMAEEIAGELELDDYDYDEEAGDIKDEIGVDPWTMTMADVRPVKRGLPDASDVAFDPGEVPNPADKPQTPGAPDGAGTGASYDPTSSAGRAAVKKTSKQDGQRGMTEYAMAEALHASGAIVIRP